MAATKELRAFLGRLSWIAGNCPKTEVDGDSHVRGSHQRAAGRRQGRGTCQNRRGDTRSKHGLFAVKRLGTAMPWLKAAFETPETMLIRREPLLEQEPTWCCHRRFTRRSWGCTYPPSGLPVVHCGGFCRCNPTRQRHWKLSSTSLEGLGVL